MSGVNKVIIIGNCGKDPETRYMPNGGAVTNISIATSENWKDKQTGEKKESTEWHNIVFFGKVAEIAGEYLKKGSKVYVEGKLKTDKYDKEGVTHYSTKIVANQMQMLDGRNTDNAQQGGQPAQAQSKPARSEEGFDDDIPF